MGVLLCKFSSCCCCCMNNTHHRNSVGVLPEIHLKVLLLGLVGSGKTEVGHTLSKQKRLDYDSTNGVQFYPVELAEQKLAITEIGGNEEMQKIWHHYFVTNMGIIYCFDMSSSYEELQATFECLRRTLRHPCVRGKPILLVATKSDLVDEGLQLYDIENTFQLTAMAKCYSSSLQLCYNDSYKGEMEEAVQAGGSSSGSLFEGITWLVNFMLENSDILKIRIKCDTNMMTWQQQLNKFIAEGKIKRTRSQRFAKQLRNAKKKKFWRFSSARHRSNRIRPRTAPAIIHTISYNHDDGINLNSTSTDIVEETKIVPNGHVTEV